MGRKDIKSARGSIAFTGVLAGATILAVTQAAAQSSTAAYDVVHNSWSMGANMPIGTQSAAAGAIGKNIYVVGGVTGTGAPINANQIYNTETDQWTTGAAMPTAEAGAGAVVNGILYVIGPGHTLQAYDPVSNTWRVAPLPFNLDSVPSAVVYNNVIYVIVGYSGRTISNGVESYDPATNTWTREAGTLVAKGNSAMGVLGAMIVSAGGSEIMCGIQGCGPVETGDNEGYNVTRNKWKMLAAVPTSREAGCAWAIAGQLYFAGGLGTYGQLETALSVLEAYSPKSNSWTTLASMPMAVSYPSSAKVGGRLYCFGGFNNANGTANYVQIYQP